MKIAFHIESTDTSHTVKEFRVSQNYNHTQQELQRVDAGKVESKQQAAVAFGVRRLALLAAGTKGERGESELGKNQLPGRRSSARSLFCLSFSLMVK
jgi:hypothetical protein